MGGGSTFGDEANPKVVVKVGQAGDKGTVEVTDVM
jgi:glucan 1,3-beta-glucosidase